MAIPYSHWMALPLSTRIKIASALGIQKLRSTHVANDQVLDDGYNIQDVENAIKVLPMQQYLNSTETDVFILFKNLIDTVEGVVPEVKEEIVPVEEVVKPIKKSKGRPKKK